METEADIKRDFYLRIIRRLMKRSSSKIWLTGQQEESWREDCQYSLQIKKNLEVQR